METQAKTNTTAASLGYVLTCLPAICAGCFYAVFRLRGRNLDAQKVFRYLFIPTLAIQVILCFARPVFVPEKGSVAYRIEHGSDATEYVTDPGFHFAWNIPLRDRVTYYPSMIDGVFTCKAPQQVDVDNQNEQWTIAADRLIVTPDAYEAWEHRVGSDLVTLELWANAKLCEALQLDHKIAEIQVQESKSCSHISLRQQIQITASKALGEGLKFGFATTLPHLQSVTVSWK